MQDDLAIQRDAAFAISNITDSGEIQADLLVCEGGVLIILKEIGTCAALLLLLCCGGALLPCVCAMMMHDA